MILYRFLFSPSSGRFHFNFYRFQYATSSKCKQIIWLICNVIKIVGEMNRKTKSFFFSSYFHFIRDFACCMMFFSFYIFFFRFWFIALVSFVFSFILLFYLLSHQFNNVAKNPCTWRERKIMYFESPLNAKYSTAHKIYNHNFRKRIEMTVRNKNKNEVIEQKKKEDNNKIANNNSNKIAHLIQAKDAT